MDDALHRSTSAVTHLCIMLTSRYPFQRAAVVPAATAKRRPLRRHSVAFRRPLRVQAAKTDRLAMNGTSLKMFQEDGPLVDIDPEISEIIQNEKKRQV